MSYSLANPLDTCLGVDFRVSPPTPTAEDYEDLLFKLELLTYRYARAKDSLAHMRCQLKSERKRGDDHFKMAICLEAGVRRLLAKNEELQDKNDALENEVLDRDESIEELRERERNRRRRVMGHDGVMGKCCPYSGRRGRLGGLGGDHEHEGEEDDDDCFMCCPCCALSKCTTECGPNCGIAEHRHNEDGDGNASTATTRTNSTAEGDLSDVNADANDGPDSVMSAAYPGDEYGGHQEEEEDFLELELDGILDDCGTAEGPAPDNSVWARDGMFWEEIADENYGNEFEMDESYPRAEEKGDGFVWTSDADSWIGRNEHYEGYGIESEDIRHDGQYEETEMAKMGGDFERQKTMADIAASPLFPNEVEPPTQTHIRRDQEQRLLMDIVNKFHNFDQGASRERKTQNKQPILYAREHGKSVEDNISQSENVNQQWKSTAAKAYMSSKYLEHYGTERTIWEMEN